jgi:aminoglycoside phosphotransferase (APT) family kinase protein
MNRMDMRGASRERDAFVGSDLWTRSLADLHDHERGPRMLTEAIADSGWVVREVRSVEIVRERPGARRTLRLRLSVRRAGCVPVDATWYGIQYRGTGGESALRSLRFLKAAAAPEVRVTGPIGYCRDSRLLLVPSLDGRPLTGALEDPIESRVAASLKRLGRALASFHSIRGPGPSARTPMNPAFQRFDSSREVARLDEAAGRISNSVSDPRLAERLRDGVEVLRGELADTLSSARGVSLLHRDLHPDHVIFSADGIGLLDLDEAGFGEPEADLGMLTAHLVLTDLRRTSAIRLAPARAEALRAGYMSVGSVRPERLATYTSAALLYLAAGDRIGAIGAPDRTRLATALVEEALPELSRV